MIIELRYWEQLKTAEIAEILRLPHGTVRSRLRRARALLDEALSGLAQSPSELQSTRANLEEWAARCRHELSLLYASTS